jgi:hypothetical protein
MTRGEKLADIYIDRIVYRKANSGSKCNCKLAQEAKEKAFKIPTKCVKTCDLPSEI